MDIPAYLERINYRGSQGPTAQTLRELQVAHLLAVPFENLSIHSGQPIILGDDALFDKVVGQRRGGFCYELNGLFAALLRGLGFEVDMLSARVANAAGEFGPDFDHMTLMVRLDDRWLADVGFGDSFREPLLMDEREEQVQKDRAYKIAPDDDRWVLWQREDGDDWKAQYSFTLKPFTYPDYAEMCRYHQTSPQSHFTRARVCTRATPQGRITLSELRFITTENGNRHEQLLSSEEEYATVLKEQFGVVMSA
ncbi:MAG: arylamine N-acetyltransferase [Acidobacteriota bacterium]